MSEVVAGLVAGDPVERLSEGVPEFINGAESSATQLIFDFAEDHFDGIQIGTVGWQIHQPCFALGDGIGDAMLFVCCQVIHHDDVAWPQ